MTNGLDQAIWAFHTNLGNQYGMLPRYNLGSRFVNNPAGYDGFVDELLDVNDYEISGKELALISSNTNADSAFGKMFIDCLLKRAAINGVQKDRRKAVYLTLDQVALDGGGKTPAEYNQTREYLKGIENASEIVIDLMTTVWNAYFTYFPQALSEMPDYVKNESHLDIRCARDGYRIIGKTIKTIRQGLYHSRYNLRFSPDISDEAQEAAKSARIPM